MANWLIAGAALIGAYTVYEHRANNYSRTPWPGNVRVMASSGQDELSCGFVYTKSLFNALREGKARDLEQAHSLLERETIVLDCADDDGTLFRNVQHPVAGPVAPSRASWVVPNHSFRADDPRRKLVQFLLENFEDFSKASAGNEKIECDATDCLSINDLSALIEQQHPAIAPLAGKIVLPISEAQRQAGQVSVHDLISLIENRGERDRWGDPLGRIRREQVKDLAELFTDNDPRKLLMHKLADNFENYASKSSQDGVADKEQMRYVTVQDLLQAAQAGDPWVVDPGVVQLAESLPSGDTRFNVQEIVDLLQKRGQMNRFGDPLGFITKAQLERLLEPNSQEQAPAPHRYVLLIGDYEARRVGYFEQAKDNLKSLYDLSDEQILISIDANQERFEKDLRQLAKWTAAHPGEEVELMVVLNAHGAALKPPSFRSKLYEGEGRQLGFTSIGLNEREAKLMFEEVFANIDTKNVRISFVIDSCYAGAWTK